MCVCVSVRVCEREVVAPPDLGPESAAHRGGGVPLLNLRPRRRLVVAADDQVPAHELLLYEPRLPPALFDTVDAVIPAGKMHGRARGRERERE